MKDNLKGYAIITNADGCVSGNYYSELLTKEEAIATLSIIKEVDSKAFMYPVFVTENIK